MCVYYCRDLVEVCRGVAHGGALAEVRRQLQLPEGAEHARGVLLLGAPCDIYIYIYIYREREMYTFHNDNNDNNNNSNMNNNDNNNNSVI